MGRAARHRPAQLGRADAGVSVDLAVADPAPLEELLLAAWVHRAPAALRRQLPG